MHGPRRQGRAYALQLLYQIEISSDEAAEPRDRFWGSRRATRKVRALAEGLVDDTLGHLPQIDARLKGELEQWKLGRLPVVVRNLLRMAVCELEIQHDVPYQVVINEAVELAREFMDEESARFVNSVLEKCRLAAGLSERTPSP